MNEYWIAVLVSRERHVALKQYKGCGAGLIPDVGGFFGQLTPRVNSVYAGLEQEFRSRNPMSVLLVLTTYHSYTAR